MTALLRSLTIDHADFQGFDCGYCFSGIDFTSKNVRGQDVQ